MPEEKSNSNTSLADRRRADKRIPVNVAVEVTQMDAAGHTVTERTFIEDVSDFGCRFSTRGKIVQGATVSVRLLSPNGRPLADEEPRIYEVMWVARKERSYTAGARLRQGEKLPADSLVSPNETQAK